MTVSNQDAMRILENIKKTADWRSDLMTANDLFHLGPKKFEDAVKRYGKILEILLRLIYKEISMIVPPSQKQAMVSIEDQIGKGKKPIGDFGLGQLIALFSRSGLFNLTNKTPKFDVLDATELNRINDFRIDQTHYVGSIITSQVDEIRKYTTRLLLETGLISIDPEMIPTAPKRAGETDAQRQRMEGLQRLLQKVRLGLIEKEKIELEYPLDRGDGWYGDVKVNAEIVGTYFDQDETLAVVVRVLEALTPEAEEEEAYQALDRKVRQTIESIAPEAKEKLKILFFADYDGKVEGHAYAYSDEKGSLCFQ